MRKIALIACLTLASLTLVSPALAKPTTLTFEATFNEGFGGATAHQCPATETFSFCGTGTVEGFGEATSLTELVSFSGFDPETDCGQATFRRTITLEDGSTLVLLEEGTICFPGESSSAPGSLKSFGNPFTFEGTFTVVGGTGIFKGAKGSGTSAIHTAGDAGSSTLSGTITLR